MKSTCLTWVSTRRKSSLSFEKEVLGIYVSGHPLEKYETMWRKNISALTSDFAAR